MISRLKSLLPTPAAIPIAQRPEILEDVVALTFDDGPATWTEPILETLRSVDAKATFFVIADAIPGREATLHRAVAEGHELANHTATHRRLDLMTGRDDVKRELELASSAIERVAGTAPQQFRAPGFGLSPTALEVARELGFRWAIQSSVRTDDYNLASSDAIVNAILPRVRRGSIINLHDGRPPYEPPYGKPGGTLEDRWATVAAVEEIVRTLTDRGFRFCTVSELLAM